MRISDNHMHQVEKPVKTGSYAMANAQVHSLTPALAPNVSETGVTGWGETCLVGPTYAEGRATGALKRWLRAYTVAKGPPRLAWCLTRTWVTSLSHILEDEVRKDDPLPQSFQRDRKAGCAMLHIGDAVSSRNMAAALFDAVRVCIHV